MKILAAVIAAIAIPAFFVAGDSSAASQSFSYDSTSNPIGYSFYDSSVVGFVPKYVSIEVSGSDLVNLNKTVFNVPAGSSTSGASALFDSTGYLYDLISLPQGSVFTFSSSRYGNTYSIILTFYDSLPVGEPEPCPECPEIPELPYGEKLDHLTAAIIFVPATMLVIYFMFAIYSMFFRGLK